MDRANAVAAAVAQRDRDMADHGRQYSYGDWLQPIVSTNTLEASSMATPSQDPIADAPVPARRGRGRPRVNKPRDLSAIEVCDSPAASETLCALQLRFRFVTLVCLALRIMIRIGFFQRRWPCTGRNIDSS